MSITQPCCPITTILGVTIPVLNNQSRRVGAELPNASLEFTHIGMRIYSRPGRNPIKMQEVWAILETKRLDFIWAVRKIEISTFGVFAANLFTEWYYHTLGGFGK